MQIRAITRNDIPILLSIEAAVHISPWTQETFAVCFEAGYLGWAAVLDGKIIGFIIVSMVQEECHILNVCVSLKHQRQGIATALLKHALNEAKARGMQVAYLEVRKTNTRAIALYKKYAFLPVGERKDYYPTINGHEDALIYAKLLESVDNTPSFLLNCDAISK